MCEEHSFLHGILKVRWIGFTLHSGPVQFGLNMKLAEIEAYVCCCYFKLIRAFNNKNENNIDINWNEIICMTHLFYLIFFIFHLSSFFSIFTPVFLPFYTDWMVLINNPMLKYINYPYQIRIKINVINNYIAWKINHNLHLFVCFLPLDTNLKCLLMSKFYLIYSNDDFIYYKWFRFRFRLFVYSNRCDPNVFFQSLD